MTEREFDGASLGNRIKLLRALRRMSLEEVGDAAGLTKSHVWELEQGRSRNPTVNAVWGLARALSVSPSAILGLDDAMPPIHPLALEIAGMVDRALRNPPKHVYWMPGEPDCPRDIKAPNGELHTLRRKQCGLDDPRDQVCAAPHQTQPA